MAASISQTCYDYKIHLLEAIREGKIVPVAFEKCPLCCESRGGLLCDSCVNSGDFTHTQRKDGQRFSQKKLEWIAKKKEREALCKRFEYEIENFEKTNAKKTDIELLKKKISCLKKAIKETKAKCEAEKIELYKSKKRRRQAQAVLEQDHATVIKNQKQKVLSLSELPTQRLPNLEELKCVEFNKDCDVKQLIQLAAKTPQSQQRDLKDGTCIDPKSVPILMKELELYHQYLAYRRSFFLETLSHRIFPINEVFGDSDPLEMSMATALKDACETAFIGGRWVHGDHKGENHCTIVGSTLADYSGASSAISLFVMLNRYALDNPVKIPVGNPSYGVQSALTYTTMFITLAANVLDVHLPRKCSLKELKDNMNESDFCNFVWRLHQNILHLAYSQNVDPEKLLNNLSLHNVLAIVQCPTLGRCGPFVPDYELPVAVDLCSLEYESEEDLDPASADVELSRDWERVPSSLPSYDTINMGYSSPLDNNTSTAGMIYNTATKAAASLTGWTGWFSSYYSKK
ncbi:beclin 1-associated autophagy-related key regulator-like [Biomphalaria glabrata]|uniref:Beclin 1-associated autophagy-related key regulator-like n=1 Tax=Biomphalaria glabrata TaxID=6526 RepID=A0A9U8E2B1_BIOGL|nr:beclin 1-associated autophagy-related key regulator-like [Biomphalaria glabrata]